MIDVLEATWGLHVLHYLLQANYNSCKESLSLHKNPYIK
ncbi:hypothetical protein AALP_AAs67142U000100 [Arabis alpina]|uniref:Uncharacterized protein n=1 Tax=Arabis alpina TaxID=50452 RepID=A0A087G1X9_ARAAL|nr:hypothetical protein AALP_AAs67142U000100 [Arabis alpina]